MLPHFIGCGASWWDHVSLRAEDKEKSHIFSICCHCCCRDRCFRPKVILLPAAACQELLPPLCPWGTPLLTLTGSAAGLLPMLRWSLVCGPSLLLPGPAGSGPGPWLQGDAPSSLQKRQLISWFNPCRTGSLYVFVNLVCCLYNIVLLLLKPFEFPKLNWGLTHFFFSSYVSP